MKANYLLFQRKYSFCLTLFMALCPFLTISQITYSQVTTPVRNAGTGTNVTGIGTVAWTNPGSVIADDAAYATVVVSGGAISNYLQATNYGFSIPAEATINGITVTIGRFENTTASGTDVRDNIVRLLKGGTITGDNENK